MWVPLWWTSACLVSYLRLVFWEVWNSMHTANWGFIVDNLDRVNRAGSCSTLYV